MFHCLIIFLVKVCSVNPYHATEQDESNTNVTARPSPNDVFTFFDTPRNEHIPRKKANIMLSTKMDLKKRLIKCSIILSYFLCRNKLCVSISLLREG